MAGMMGVLSVDNSKSTKATKRMMVSGVAGRSNPMAAVRYIQASVV